MNISLNKKSYKIKDLKRIKNNNGDILHYVKKNWKSIPNIQEIYFQKQTVNRLLFAFSLCSPICCLRVCCWLVSAFAFMFLFHF